MQRQARRAGGPWRAFFVFREQKKGGRSPPPCNLGFDVGGAARLWKAPLVLSSTRASSNFAEQMREIDRLTTERYEIPSMRLMEAASASCLKAIRRRFDGGLAAKKVLVLCGKGNNGGDGAGRSLDCSLTTALSVRSCCLARFAETARRRTDELRSS